MASRTNKRGPERGDEDERKIENGKKPGEERGKGGVVMGEKGRGLIACLPSGTYRLGPGIAMAISSRPTGTSCDLLRLLTVPTAQRWAAHA